MLILQWTRVSPSRHSEGINNRTVCEIPEKTVRLDRRKSLAVVSPKHSRMPISSIRSSDQAPSEFVHIDATLHRICDTCKGTKHDNSQLCCKGLQSLCESHCRMMSYCLMHIPSDHQELFA